LRHKRLSLITPASLRQIFTRAGRDDAMSPKHLVYAVNDRDHGKLVFVPMAKLLAKAA
jgi:hypothetical protein